MSWIDDTVKQVDREAADNSKRYQALHTELSPTVMKMFSEIGDKIFSKEGFFGKKRYYDIETLSNKANKSFGWRFKINTDKVSGSFDIVIYISELAGEEEKIKHPGLLGKNCLRVHANCGSVGHVQLVDSDSEKSLEECLAEAVTTYLREIKRFGGKIFF